MNFLNKANLILPIIMICLFSAIFAPAAPQQPPEAGRLPTDHSGSGISSPYGSVRSAASDVRRGAAHALEIGVVDHDQPAVARLLDVEFDGGRAHRERALEGRQGVLGSVARGPPVRDELRHARHGRTPLRQGSRRPKSSSVASKPSSLSRPVPGPWKSEPPVVKRPAARATAMSSRTVPPECVG